jgi:hypothetical protein
MKESRPFRFWGNLKFLFQTQGFRLRPRLVRGLGPWIGLANTSVS